MNAGLSLFCSAFLIPVLCLVVLPGMTPVLPQENPKPGQQEPEDRPGRLRTVVLDPGHGGKDPGCMTRRNRESRIVLKIALELGRRIREEMPNVKVIYTRSTDVFIELNERSAIANRNKADLFISIHVNASPSSSRVYGTETYTMGLHKTNGNLEVAKRENAVILKESNYRENYRGFDPDSPLAHIMLANYQHAFMNSSIDFAQKVEWSFKKNAERHSHGVKQAGFLVLWRTTMPSVLVETGFITNPEEERFLASEEGQDQIANSIFRAFKAYKEEVDSVE
ncbi:N-acetylmuramoyl-L-alanine amidase family protein [Larkinella soli]|uniref:N-acetylmuramoyl-L-alanine amidase family protein n=1 Tax=Larkinella soli TaxID=1770527 RepID=UPI0019D1BF45|nr:N-acetylmuramoyl-L-alanine amidase [Larkinella soli]